MNEIRKAVAVVIQDNRFFMVRKKGKDIWTSLGGHIEEGETEAEALLREIDEEVHCKATIVRKLGDFRAKAAHDDAIVVLYAYLVELQGTPHLDDPELAECAFIPHNYEKLNIKLPPSITEQVIPFCKKEGLLDW